MYNRCVSLATIICLQWPQPLSACFPPHHNFFLSLFPAHIFPFSLSHSQIIPPFFVQSVQCSGTQFHICLCVTNVDLITPPLWNCLYSLLYGFTILCSALCVCDIFSGAPHRNWERENWEGKGERGAEGERDGHKSGVNEIMWENVTNRERIDGLLCRERGKM